MLKTEVEGSINGGVDVFLKPYLNLKADVMSTIPFSRFQGSLLTIYI